MAGRRIFSERRLQHRQAHHVDDVEIGEVIGAE
jgi:hypothetical protein